MADRRPGNDPKAVERAGITARQVSLSRVVTHALRHAPEQYGIELDAEGWTDLDALVRSVARMPQWTGLTRADVLEMMRVNTKRRHEVSGDRIRALYGHSTPATIERPAVRPPEVLFHGTTPAAAEAILREGLRPMQRQHVHLSASVDTALRVGGRRTRRPVLLQVRARDAAGAGVRFFVGGDEIWLAEPIAARWISRVDADHSGSPA